MAIARQGGLAAYMVGGPDSDIVWGRSGWIRAAGCSWAAESDLPLVADLYAHLGSRWVAQGVFDHYAVVPASADGLLDVFFALSFGIQHVHGLCDLRAVDGPAPELPEGVTIRQADRSDQEALVALSDVVWGHQVGAPVWAPMLPEYVESNRQGWLELLEDPTVTVWLAFDHDRPVASQGYYPSEMTGMHMLGDERTCHLGIAGTLPSYRGHGISTALTWTGLAHARQQGYAVCETDWRSTNLLSSRFWPRFGFRPAFYRLHRRVDERIAWAHGGRPRGGDS
jgi:GNAT superfamily N-acetyltransferase